MSKSAAIRTAMKDDATIGALVGSSVHYVRLPQDFSGNGITYSNIGGTPEHTHGGTSSLSTMVTTLQLWSESASDHESLIDAVISFWNNLSGLITSYDVTLADPQLIGATDWQEDSELYRSIIQLTLNFRN